MQQKKPHLTAPRLALLMAGLAVVAGCAKEPPPRSVAELMENPLVLEAALVRCTQNRAETRYEAECINAREAVKLIEAKDEAERRAELEAQSVRKREALRNTQRAAAEARRRAAEEVRRREEAEYLAQFGELPPGALDSALDTEGNVPLAVIPSAADNDGEYGADYDAQFESEFDPPAANTAGAGSNAPVVETEPEPEPEAEPATDLESIRDELRRRNDEN